MIDESDSVVEQTQAMAAIKIAIKQLKILLTNTVIIFILSAKIYIFI